MLFSFQQAADAQGLPKHTQLFAKAASTINSPQGLILGSQAFDSFLQAYGVGSEVETMIQAITDQESVERVEFEVSRRIVTGRIPEDVIEAMTEAREILSMDEKLNISDIPLVAVLSTDHHLETMPVIINIIGKKALADAIRTLWSRAFVHPYPNGIPKAAIVLYRMPPAIHTAHVQIQEQQIVVDAVQGWGALVQANEIADSFVFELDGSIVSKEIRSQDKMVYRNPRTGEVVQTSVAEPKQQTITDDQARTFALQALRSDCQSAVFGIGESKSWLVRVDSKLETSSSANTSSEMQESSPQEHVEQQEDSDYDESPNIEIVELVDEPKPEEPKVEIEEAPEEPEYDDPMRGPADAPKNPATIESSFESTMLVAESLLEHVYVTIEKILRDWLHGEQPQEFTDLVSRVSNKRVVPYKNRLLTLHEMKSQGAFSSPSPEAVRFALETLVRFKKEF